MDKDRFDGRRVWILAMPDGRRAALVTPDASVPVTLSRLPRTWDLLGEHDHGTRPDVDALVVAVGAGNDPRRAVDPYLDTDSLGRGDGSSERADPASCRSVRGRN